MCVCVKCEVTPVTLFFCLFLTSLAHQLQLFTGTRLGPDWDQSGTTSQQMLVLTLFGDPGPGDPLLWRLPD